MWLGSFINSLISSLATRRSTNQLTYHFRACCNTFILPLVNILAVTAMQSGSFCCNVKLSYSLLKFAVKAVSPLTALNVCECFEH